MTAGGNWAGSHRYRAARLHRPANLEAAAVRRVLVELEAALRPFGARPHWGKIFLADAAAIGPLYPRLGDFAALVGRLDPREAFRNPWLEARVLGAG
jgi:alditol oxidase